MAERLPTQGTKYAATGVLPPSSFQYVFEMTNQKENKLFWESSLEREVKCEPYKCSIRVSAQDCWEKGSFVTALWIKSSLRLLDCNESSVPSLVVDHRVTADLIREKTLVTIDSKGGFRMLNKEDTETIFVDDLHWLLSKIKAFGEGAATLRITVELKHLPEQKEWTEEDAGSTTTVAQAPDPPYVKGLRSNEQLIDIKIVAGGKEFRAHKLILSAVSPVFARMFQTPMKEATTGEIIIDDLESGSMQLLLDYIYTGKCVPETNNETLDLFYCSEKYDLEGLKALMLRQMTRSLSEENAVKFLSAATNIAPGSSAVADMIAFCKQRFLTLCSISPENKQFLVEHVDLFCPSHRQNLVKSK